MSGKIIVEPFLSQSADQIFNLILPIQTEEFGIRVTREGQPDLEHIADFYQIGAGNFWVALAGARVVGTIGLKDIGNGQVALRKMFVHRDYRGKEKGTAQKLLDVAFDWAKQHNVKDIFLGTTEKFLAAHRFYEKNSFLEIDKATLPHDFPVMSVDTKFYRLRLGKVAIPS